MRRSITNKDAAGGARLLLKTAWADFQKLNEWLSAVTAAASSSTDADDNVHHQQHADKKAVDDGQALEQDESEEDHHTAASISTAMRWYTKCEQVYAHLIAQEGCSESAAIDFVTIYGECRQRIGEQLQVVAIEREIEKSVKRHLTR